MKHARTKSARGSTITSSFHSHLNPYIPVGFTVLAATVLGLAVCSPGYATPDSLSKSEFEANAVVWIPPDPPASKHKSKQPSVGPAKQTRSITDVRSGKIPMCILYAGYPGSDREKDFVSFLRDHFREVKTEHLTKFSAAQAKTVDVTILDPLPLVVGRAPRVRFPQGYSEPTVTVGVGGALICSTNRLKTGYL